MGPESTAPGDRRNPSRRVADELREGIIGGRYGSGERLPSYRALMATHGIAFNTAADAVRILADEGLVVIEHGRGAFVRTPAPVIRLAGDRYSRRYRGGPTPFRRECERLRLTARVEVLSIDRTLPPLEIAERLAVPSDRKSVLRRYNHYFADDVPVQVVTTYLAWETARATPLTKPKTGPDGIYGRLEEAGHIMTRSRDEVTARMPTPDETRLLHLPAGTPVLDVLHTSFDQDDRPFEVTRFVARADRAGLLVDQPVD